MSRHARLFALAALLAFSAPAQAEAWQLQPADGSRGAVITFGSGEPGSYRFECAADGVVVSQSGVTKLLDLQTGKQIGDDAGAVMTPGAAVMALFTGKGEPQFVPAAAAKNPAGGWDLTIRLPKKDRQLKAVGKSEMISLFTTGHTIAVPMDGAARAKWKDFLHACNAAG